MRPALAIVVLVLLTGAASADIRRVCSGEFTDMRAIGLTLSDCDLNFISDPDADYVRQRCGEPWTIDSEGTAKSCTIAILAGPRRPNIRGVPVYAVRKVLRP